MEPVLTKNQGKHVVKIYQDSDHNPREDQDNLGEILYLKKSRYTLGDRAVDESEMESITNNPDYIYLPVYAYVHGGVALSTSNQVYPFNDQWDAGRSGIICVSKAKIRENFMVKRITKAILEKTYEVLRSEVKECSMILGGDVYGYVIEDDSGEQIESVWGFVGTPEEVAQEAIQSL